MLVGAARRVDRRQLAVALTGAGWLLGVGTTAAVVGTPYLVFGLHSHSAHLLLDTVDVCVSLLVTFLLWGRFRRTRRLQDLLLAQALLMLAVAGSVPVPAALLGAEGGERTVEVWSALTLRGVAAVLVAAAALLGRRRRLDPGLRPVALTPLAVVAVVLLALWSSRALLPLAVAQDPPASATEPVIVGHPVLLAVQVVAGSCFTVASVAFALQAARSKDPLLLWLGPACALAATARANYFLFPSIYSDWIYTGDFLRTASCAVLLIGAAREISAHWTGWAQATVLEDRRRLARELHDGVVQELGFIRSTVNGAVRADGDREALVEACDRAIDEARAAVDALGRSPEEPLGFVLHRAARQVADRYGGRVLVDLDDSIHVGHEHRHALVRITREAVSNAIRHGAAATVCITLVRDLDHVCLVVRDDGRGFDVSATGRTGYGLTSMRDRAVGMSAAFEIESVPGRGTTVKVTWAAAAATTGRRRRT